MAVHCDQQVKKTSLPPGGSSSFPGMGPFGTLPKQLDDSALKLIPLFSPGGAYTLSICPKRDTQPDES